MLALLLLLGIGGGVAIATRGGPRRRAIRKERKAERRRRPERREELRQTAMLLRQRAADREARRALRHDRMAGVSLFGADEWSLDPRTGTLVRPKPAASPSGDPRQAARDGTVALQGSGHSASSPARWPYDLSGTSWSVSTREKPSATPDGLVRDVAVAHGVSLLRATDPASGSGSYVFTTSPRTAITMGKLAGLVVSRLV